MHCGSVRVEWCIVGSVRNDWYIVGSVRVDWCIVGSVRVDWCGVGSVTNTAVPHYFCIMFSFQFMKTVVVFLHLTSSKLTLDFDSPM